MFDLNRWPILWPIVAPIQIKHIHSSVSYQQATHQKYDRCCDELPSGYGPLNSDLILEGLGQDENKKEDPCGNQKDGHIVQPPSAFSHPQPLLATDSCQWYSHACQEKSGPNRGRVGSSRAIHN